MFLSNLNIYFSFWFFPLYKQVPWSKPIPWHCPFELQDLIKLQTLWDISFLHFGLLWLLNFLFTVNTFLKDFGGSLLQCSNCWMPSFNNLTRNLLMALARLRNLTDLWEFVISSFFLYVFLSLKHRYRLYSFASPLNHKYKLYLMKIILLHNAIG